MGEIKGKITRIFFPKKGSVPVEKNGAYFHIVQIAELDGTFTEENNVEPAAVQNTSGRSRFATLVGEFPSILSENQCLAADVKTVTYVNQAGETSFQLRLIKLNEFSYEEFNKETILEYLKNSIQGISKSQCLSIIGKFGAETMEHLGDEDALCSIPGITREKAKSIVTQHLNSAEFLKIAKSLENVGIDNPIELATKMLCEYGEANAFAVMYQKPYKLYEDGLCDFASSLAIATRRKDPKKIIFGYDHIDFVKASIMDVFQQIENSGHCSISDYKLFLAVNQNILLQYSHYAKVIKNGENSALSDKDFAEKEVAANKNVVIAAIKELLEQGILAREEFVMDGVPMFFLYRKEIYDAEKFAAQQILKMVHPDEEDLPDNIDDMLAEMQEEIGMHYADCQLDAIKMPLTSHVVIVTGGPGTGKTTTVNGLIKFQQKLNPKIKILCAAPTGRASQRMAEATGMPASTIHRLLGVDVENGKLNGFIHNEHNPLDCDLLVIDEFSMVDILLFGSLMKAIKPTTKVAIVGDSNQLPSVGPGSVLRDMIDSKIVPSVELQIVFRQDSTSLIALNANNIKLDKLDELKANKEDGNFFAIYSKTGDDDIRNRTLSLFKSTYDSYVAKGMKDAIYQVQILCPVKKAVYALSAAALNPVIRDIVNPARNSKKEYRNSKGKCIFREGDKVMQTKNDYAKDVFNGDLGIIETISTESKEIVVKFQFKPELVTYTFGEANAIELAYATTIHKSQGSEYACTIIPMSPDYNGQGFNSKNLLYTGITRAKKVFYFIGDPKAITYGLKNKTTTNRSTTLRQRISGEHNADDIAGKELLGEIKPQELE